MSEPHLHLAYCPRRAGLLRAVMWFAQGDHAFGWLVGHRHGRAVGRFFMLQDCFGARDTSLLRSMQNDVLGDWEAVHRGGALRLARVPVPASLHRTLSRLQNRFERQWLFFDRDPDAPLETAALRGRGLPVAHANIRASRLDALHTGGSVWRYDSPSADRIVLAELAARWPLDVFDAAMTATAALGRLTRVA